ncbi:hypothetical protein E8E11_000500 [Didymella keratinophila]|nr:hypothetical protein E8E11_000500 [Didymella keratinophila]
MAGGSKKRRASQSPNRSDTVKNACQVSTAPSLRSQRDSSGAQVDRAKSVFRCQYDPYFPHKKRGSTSLADGDYFRLRVAATTTDFNTDVVKKAVQGLVKICLAQDVLDDLGVVVTQYMHDEEAPESDIVKTAEVFRSEMFHRGTWILAEYFDTPVKVEASIMAIMAASASLHCGKSGEDILETVIASLQKLRERVPGKSTEHLKDQIDTETMNFHSQDHAKGVCPDQDATAVEERLIDNTEQDLSSSKWSSNKRSKKYGQATTAEVN